MRTIAEALAAIPKLRDELNATDDQLSATIREIEELLTKLRIGVPVDVHYTTLDGAFLLSFCKWDMKWQLVWGTEAEDDPTKDIALVSAPRHVRAEVFSPGDAGTYSPIEQLIVAIPDTLSNFVQERSPQLEVAKRVVAALKAARLE